MSDPRKGECLIPEMGIIGTAADYNQAEMLDYEQRRNTQLEEECGALREEKAELLATCEALAEFTRDLLKLVTPEQIKKARLTTRMLKLSDQGFNAMAKARGKK